MSEVISPKKSPSPAPRKSTKSNHKTSPLLRSRTFSNSNMGQSESGDDSSNRRMSGPRSILKGLGGSLVLKDKSRNSSKKIRKLNTQTSDLQRRRTNRESSSRGTLLMSAGDVNSEDEGKTSSSPNKLAKS